MSATNASIPNPFTANQDQLILAFYPAQPYSYVVNLYVLSGIFALAFVLNLVGVAGRVHRKTLRLYRRERTVHGEYVVPDPLFATIFQAIFVLFIQVYIWQHILVITRHISQLNAIIIQGSIWLPLWYSGWSMVRTVVNNAILARYRNFDVGTIPRWATPKFLSIMTRLVPFLILTPVMTIFTFASIKANRSFAAFEKLTSVVGDAAAAFNGTINPTVSEAIVLAEVKLAQDTSTWKHLVKTGYGVWILGALVQVMIFVPFTILHLRLIRSQLRSLSLFSLFPSTASTSASMSTSGEDLPSDLLPHLTHAAQNPNTQRPLSHQRAKPSQHSTSTFDSGDWDWDETTGALKLREQGSAERKVRAEEWETGMERARKALKQAFLGVALQLAALSALVIAYGTLGVVETFANAVGLDGVIASRHEVLASLWIYASIGLVAQCFTIIRSFDRASPLTKSTLGSNLEAAVGLSQERSQRDRERGAKRSRETKEGAGFGEGNFHFPPAERGF